MEFELINLMWNWNWPNGIEWNWPNGTDPMSGTDVPPVFKMVVLGKGELYMAFLLYTVHSLIQTFGR